MSQTPSFFLAISTPARKSAPAAASSLGTCSFKDQEEKLDWEQQTNQAIAASHYEASKVLDLEIKQANALFCQKRWNEAESAYVELLPAIARNPKQFEKLPKLWERLATIRQNQAAQLHRPEQRNPKLAEAAASYQRSLNFQRRLYPRSAPTAAEAVKRFAESSPVQLQADAQGRFRLTLEPTVEVPPHFLPRWNAAELAREQGIQHLFNGETPRALAALQRAQSLYQQACETFTKEIHLAGFSTRIRLGSTQEILKFWQPGSPVTKRDIRENYRHAQFYHELNDYSDHSWRTLTSRAQGDIALNEGRYREAIAHFNDALDSAGYDDRNLPLVWLLWGDIGMANQLLSMTEKNKKYYREEAEKHYRKGKEFLEEYQKLVK